MRKLLTFLIALASIIFAVCSPASAQLAGGLMFPGPGTPASSGGGGGYTGPGDIVGGWQVWYGLRAFSAAKRGTKAINVCNVSDVACVDMLTDATTGVLVVTTVGGSNCSVITCTIKTFYDQSGASACTGACDNTQATIGLRAILSTTCPGLSVPCATFTNSQAYVSATLASSVSQPFSMSWVYNRYSGTGYGGGLGFSSPDARFAAEGSANQIQVYTGTVLNATAADAAFHAANALYSNPNCAVMVDGTDTGPAACGTDGAGGTITVNSQVGNTIPEYFGEVGMTTTAFTSGNRTSLNGNQRAFWGF